MRVAMTTGDGNRDAAKAIEQATDGSLPYRAFTLRHKDYDVAYWTRLRALYKGGKALLRDQAVLDSVLVRRNAETDTIYDMRCELAFYVNYCAEIIGHILAGAGADPIRVVRAGADGSGESVSEGFYAEFAEDVSPPGGDPKPLTKFVHELLEEAMQVRTAWVLLAMPAPESDEEGNPIQPPSLRDQEESGALNVHVSCVKAEDVLHWQCDKEGELEWVLTRSKVQRQADFWTEPLTIETFTKYTRTSWMRWEIQYTDADKPAEGTPVPVIQKETPHTFGRVPLVRLSVPEGLWAMDKLESLARAHFNKRNTLYVAEDRSLLPVLYEFMAPEQGTHTRAVSSAQKDPHRATRTPRSPSHVQRRGNEDRAEFVGPSSDPFEHALKSTTEIRNEMHRVLFQMALATDFDSAAAIGRSGESKAHDAAATSVVLKALGRIVRLFLDLLYGAIAEARQDSEEHTAEGMENFDDLSVAQIVDMVEKLELVNIPSPKARVAIVMLLLRHFLPQGDDEKFMAEVEKELEKAFAAEAQMGASDLDDAANSAIAAAVKEALEGPGPDGEDLDGDLEDDDPPAPAKKAPRKGPAYDTAAPGVKRRRPKR